MQQSQPHLDQAEHVTEVPRPQIVDKDVYAFSGMASIFDEHKQAVLAVKFANGDRNWWACCCMDGTLSIGTVTPPAITQRLVGHSRAVTDFEWSAVNDFIVSTGMDSTARVWDAHSGTCVRVVTEKSECISCSYCPGNNNYFVVGTRLGQLHVYNMSTGKLAVNANILVFGAVRSLCFEATGRLLFAGDELGVVWTFSFAASTGRLTKLGKTPISPDRPISNIQVGELVTTHG